MYTTRVDIAKPPFGIGYGEAVLLLGSCFSTEIGGKLLRARFDATINPAGILFNPASIGNCYRNIAQGRRYTAADLVECGGLRHSMEHHGSFSCPTPLQTLEKINAPVRRDFEKIVVTLGTATVYEYGGRVVANCHKLPAGDFVRRRLTVGECVESLSEIARCGADVVVTVSPVRHLRDGLTENAVSKATLRLAAEELAARYERVYYFPAYEIVCDELRDYRYYGDDMLHPSAVAVEYIWQRFGETFFDTPTAAKVAAVERLARTMEHRPANPDSADYKRLIEETIKKLDKIL